jgi:hypothetical protein
MPAAMGYDRLVTLDADGQHQPWQVVTSLRSACWPGYGGVENMLVYLIRGAALGAGHRHRPRLRGHRRAERTIATDLENATDHQHPRRASR